MIISLSNQMYTYLASGFLLIIFVTFGYFIVDYINFKSQIQSQIEQLIETSAPTVRLDQNGNSSEGQLDFSELELTTEEVEAMDSVFDSASATQTDDGLPVFIQTQAAGIPEVSGEFAD